MSMPWGFRGPSCVLVWLALEFSASVLGLLLHLFHGLEALSLTQALNAREGSLGSRYRTAIIH
jgi:hypothetical protein